jgi:hypothetical protein
METGLLNFSIVLITLQQTAFCHNPEDRNLHLKASKFHIYVTCGSSGPLQSVLCIS